MDDEKRIDEDDLVLVGGPFPRVPSQAKVTEMMEMFEGVISSMGWDESIEMVMALEILRAGFAAKLGVESLRGLPAKDVIGRSPKDILREYAEGHGDETT